MTDVVTLTDAAALTGRTYRGLYSRVYRGSLAAEKVKRGRTYAFMVRVEDLAALRSCRGQWSDAEDEELLACIGRQPIEAIAERLGRRVGAVVHRYRMLGESLRSAQGYYSASETARTLGVAVPTVRYWIGRGQLRTLRYRPGYGSHRLWLISQDAIEEFIRTRITGPPARGTHDPWTWRRIAPGYFRNLAATLAAEVET